MSRRASDNHSTDTIAIAHLPDWTSSSRQQVVTVLSLNETILPKTRHVQHSPGEIKTKQNNVAMVTELGIVTNPTFTSRRSNVCRRGKQIRLMIRDVFVWKQINTSRSYYCLRADVSYFLCFPRATKEIGDVCTKAKATID